MPNEHLLIDPENQDEISNLECPITHELAVNYSFLIYSERPNDRAYYHADSTIDIDNLRQHLSQKEINKMNGIHNRKAFIVAICPNHTLTNIALAFKNQSLEQVNYICSDLSGKIMTDPVTLVRLIWTEDKGFHLISGATIDASEKDTLMQKPESERIDCNTGLSFTDFVRNLPVKKIIEAYLKRCPEMHNYVMPIVSRIQTALEKKQSYKIRQQFLSDDFVNTCMSMSTDNRLTVYELLCRVQWPHSEKNQSLYADLLAMTKAPIIQADDYEPPIERFRARQLILQYGKKLDFHDHDLTDVQQTPFTALQILELNNAGYHDFQNVVITDTDPMFWFNYLLNYPSIKISPICWTTVHSLADYLKKSRLTSLVSIEDILEKTIENHDLELFRFLISQGVKMPDERLEQIIAQKTGLFYPY